MSKTKVNDSEPNRSAADFLPARQTLPALRDAAAGCMGCELYKNATQTVFGEGPSTAQLMLIGETPGDQEDLQGHPFVGPAGRVLDEALQEAGLDRASVYVTNAVKHFKWEPRGKRRLHKKPSSREISACRPWLDSELFVVKPRVIVCMGATAAQALLGRDFRISRQRGELIVGRLEAGIIATHHPSAVLRAPEKADRDRMRRELAGDLRAAAEAAAAPTPRPAKLKSQRAPRRFANDPVMSSDQVSQSPEKPKLPRRQPGVMESDRTRNSKARRRPPATNPAEHE